MVRLVIVGIPEWGMVREGRDRKGNNVERGHNQQNSARYRILCEVFQPNTVSQVYAGKIVGAEWRSPIAVFGAFSGVWD